MHIRFATDKLVSRRVWRAYVRRRRPKHLMRARRWRRERAAARARSPFVYLAVRGEEPEYTLRFE